jgi:hypothetical protein
VYFKVLYDSQSKLTLFYLNGEPVDLCNGYALSRYHHAGDKGERKYSSSFLTSTLDAGKWSASRPGHALPLGKGSSVPTGLEAGWASELVWTERLEEKSSAGDRTPVVQYVVRRYTD